MNIFKKIGKGIERTVGKIIPHTSAADKRAQMQATKEQMDFYREQKEQLHKQADELATQKDYESKRLHEKQIRALRGNFKSRRGFLGSDADNNQPKETLG